MTIGATIHPPRHCIAVQSFRLEADSGPGLGPATAAITLHPDLSAEAAINLGFAVIQARGIDDCEELFEGFRLPLDEPVRFARYACRLDEGVDEAGERRIVYADKRGEVRMNLSEYAAARAAVTRLMQDIRMQAALTSLYAGLAEREAREADAPG